LSPDPPADPVVGVAQDHGYWMLKVTRKGGKAARVAAARPSSAALVGLVRLLADAWTFHGLAPFYFWP
jgi:hypothetical protein